MPGSPSDAQDRMDKMAAWIDQARHGSREALGELLQACRRYLLLVANRGVPEDLQARLGPSDVVHETLLAAQRDFDQFHGGSEEELLAWLSRILGNKLSNAIREHRRDRRAPGREVPVVEVPAEELLASLASDKDTPAGQAQRQERAELLRRAIACLPERDREVIHWRSYERWPFPKIAEQLGCSESAARQVWARAIKKLRKLLEVLHDSSGP